MAFLCAAFPVSISQGQSVASLVYSGDANMKVLAHLSVALCLLRISQCQETNAISVLLLNSMFPGHLFPLVSLGEELVGRGHNVTLCSTVLEGSQLLPGLAESVGIEFVSAGSDLSWRQYMETMIELQKFNSSVMDQVMLYNIQAAIRMRSMLDDDIVGKYNIIVCDFSVLPLGLYLAELGKRVIIFSSFLPPMPAVEPPWPYPITATGSQTEDMGFLGRLFSPILSKLLSKLFAMRYDALLSSDEQFVKMLQGVDYFHYPGVHIPHIVTSVLGLEVPTLLTPMRHYVGPVLRSSHPSLDQELAFWLDGKQERSVLYISMGTTGDVPKSMAKIIVTAVLNTSYDAVWALREDSIGSLEGLDIDDSRFLIRTWMPQQAVLQHPAIKACLLHCGMNGVQESLYNGLPVVCIPHVFDQFQVGSAIEQNEVGVSMYSFFDTLVGRKDFSLEDLTDAIRTVSSDKYMENAQRLSMIFKFAGGTKAAADLVVYYEDVGYEHLIPAFVRYQWTWVQYYNVDVYALLLCVAALFLCGVWRCCVCVCKKAWN